MTGGLKCKVRSPACRKEARPGRQWWQQERGPEQERTANVVDHDAVRIPVRPWGRRIMPSGDPAGASDMDARKATFNGLGLQPRSAGRHQHPSLFQGACSW